MPASHTVLPTGAIGPAGSAVGAPAADFLPRETVAPAHPRTIADLSD